MGNFVRRSVHLFARPRWLPRLTCVFAIAAVSAFGLAQTAVIGSVLKHEESASSRIIYLTESGGLIAASGKPVPGNEREPLPTLAEPSTKLPPKETASRRTNSGKGASTRKSKPTN